MRKVFLITSLLVIVFISLNVSHLYGQKYNGDFNIMMNNGIKTPESNINNFDIKLSVDQDEIINNRFYRLLQFYDIPNNELQIELKELGITLMEYIPHKTYVTSIPYSESINLSDLNIRSISPINNIDKINLRITESSIPDWTAYKGGIKYIIRYFADIPVEVVVLYISEAGFDVVSTNEEANVITIVAEQSDINDIASLSCVRFIDYESDPGEPESDDGRNLHRSNAIDTEYISGRYYDGEGVSVAINDDGFVGPHIDFKGRADQSDVAGDMVGDHGDMTVGIVGGAGNLDPTMRGMAPAAFLWVRQYNSSLPNTVSLHQNSEVMVFSSSYSNGCNAGYTTTTELVDGEIYDNPTLMQIFSAGNSNNLDCGYGAGNQWGNITGGHKIGKNVMATANLDAQDVLQSSSSRGPASDGRIKPDISAHGAGHWSTDPDNNYSPGGGTSAAAPGIAGVFTQLHQAYRELNSGDNAPSALLKASIMNTANDMGNEGPDFKFGWGKVNALKALEVLEDNRYFSDTISQNGVNTHTIVVPADVEQVRIMIYWNDVEGSTSSSYALVNDLDMVVNGPAGDSWQPLVLDHTPNPALLDLPAVQGNDSLNNVEQVRMNTPLAGNYSVVINGSVIPFGVQEYYIVYEFLFDDIRVIYPLGGEGLIPGSDERIHWDAYGTSGTFAIDYSIDGGTTWTNISTSVPGDARFIDFPVPNVNTAQARVKVTRNSVSDMSDENFSIYGIPDNLNVTAICSGFGTIGLAWDSIPGAASYDIFVLGATHMDSVTNTTDNFYYVSLTNVFDDHWFSVRARGANGEVGRRSIAINSQTNSCMLDCISEDDAGVVQIISPLEYNESCFGSTFDVEIELTNIGPNNQSGFTVSYQFGSNSVVTQTYNDTLFGNSTVNFTFTNQLTISTGGTYDLMVWTELFNDGATCNDTIEISVIYQDLISFFPYNEDFESGIFPPEKITIVNPDLGLTWQDASVTGSDGLSTTAAYMNNYSYNSTGQEDELSIAGFELSYTSLPTLTFDVAYVPYSATYQDGLRVDVSTDCGLNYTTVYFKEGTTLATASASSGTWQPGSAADWREETIDLSSFVGGMAKIRFVNITGYGNSLFIDNIQIEDINAAPVAGFISDVTNTCNGIVQFTDISQNSPQQWEWDFGDGNFSNDQNPVNIYATEGTFNVTLIVHSALGSDTLIQSGLIIVDFPDMPVAQDAEICYGDSVELSASGTGTDIYWYQNSVFLHEGNQFVTPVLTTNTTYQVENIISQPSQYVGPVDNNFGAGSYHNSSFTGTINFNAEMAFQITSAWVDADVDGMRTFYIWDAISGNGNIIDEVNVFIPQGQGRIDLNLNVPGPGTYSVGGSNVNLYRNNDGASYPYEIPGLITLTGNSASSPDFYYYLYDLEITKESCSSDPIDVIVTVIDPQFTYIATDGIVTFTDITSDAISWLWSFGDGNTSTEQNPVYTYTTSGNYDITLTVNGSCDYTESIDVTVDGIYSLEGDFGVILSPNPTRDYIYLDFNFPVEEDIIVKVYNSEASIVKEIIISVGSDRSKIDLSGEASGAYYLMLMSDSSSQLIKVLKTD